MRAVVLLLAGLMLGAAPPGRQAPEQVRMLRERSVLFAAGRKAWKEGKPEEAITALEKALLIERRVFGPWHRVTESTAGQLAGLRQTRGEWRKEADCRRAVLEARLRLDGLGHWRAMDARLQLEEALAQTKRTAAQRDGLRRALALNAQARAFYDNGQAAKAIPLARQALAIRKEVLGERHLGSAAGLNNLAMLHEAVGDHRAALPLYEQALAITKEALGERHPLHALSLSNLASLHHKMGDHEAALPLHQKALAINKQALGERHPSYATGLNNLALLYHAMGDHKAALPLFQKAIAITKEAGERHPDLATSLNNLAALYQAKGDHEAALPLYTQALAIAKEALGERHPAYATSLNNLAGLHQVMGDNKAALPLFRKALAIRKEAMGERHPHYAGSLNNLANLHQAMGDHEAALPLQQEALAIVKEALGERHPDYAKSLNNLAMLHKSMGDHEAALSDLRKALAIRREVLGERHPDYADSLNNLALLHKEMGDHKAALPLFQKALAIRKEALGERHPDYATCLNNLALLYQTMGDQKAALPLCEKALAITKENLRLASSVQSDRQQLAATGNLRHFLDTRLSLMDAGAHAHLLAWKGSVLLRQQERRLFARLAAEPRTRAAAEALRGLTREIAALSSSPTPRRERLEALTAEQERLQADLSRLSADARAARAEERLTPKALADALPDGAALVDFHIHAQHGLTDKDGKPRHESRLLAFVLRKGKPPARVDLGPAAPIGSALRAWRPLLVAGKSGLDAGAKLKALLWTPLEKHLAGAKVVLLSPDGPLASAPFAALPGAMAGTYLIEDLALAVVPVPRALPAMLKPVPKEARLKPSLLCVGDVDYDKAEASAAAEDTRSAPFGTRREWAKLPATFDESASVAKSFAGLFKGGSLIDLSKGDANKKAVREALAQVRYAHLATHGFFAHEGIKSAAAEPPAGLFGREGVTGWHPLLLSGIALSGANREPKPGEEDGILTALEVSEMDLPKLELVVLSACETGLGKSAGGEGLLGLQRAFQVAGARTVVASLWSVDDRATQALMGEFYRAAWDTKAVIGRAEALRRAQLAMLREGKRRGVGLKAEKVEGEGTRLPPYYWAAFILSGDWR